MGYFIITEIANKQYAILTEENNKFSVFTGEMTTKIVKEIKSDLKDTVHSTYHELQHIDIEQAKKDGLTLSEEEVYKALPFLKDFGIKVIATELAVLGKKIPN